MTTLADATSCAPNAGTILPVSPYLGLFYHFGMLLGVDDLETGQAYHRGKMRLHNAWQHGQGVVWGFKVEIDAGPGGRGEIRVRPGLAVDAAGRELHLDGTACLNVAAWVDAHKNDVAFRTAAAVYDPTIEIPAEGSPQPPAALPDVVQFDAHVIIKFKACLTRPVPAVSTTCAGSETETAFSRVAETIEILLVPGAPPPRPRVYHLLRLLFGLDAPDLGEDSAPLPDDAAVIARRDAVLSLPVQDQPKAYLQAFQEVAAMDVINLAPATKDGAQLLFPADDDTSVVLAQIPAIKLDKGAYVSAGTVDPSVRPVLVPTTTLQELLNGPLFGALDAGGPRVTDAQLLFDGMHQVNGIELTVTAELEEGSVAAASNPDAFSVRFFDTGWQSVAGQTVDYQPLVTPTKVKVLFSPIAVAWSRIRLVAKGTGPTPILGKTTLVPLAGAAGGPPGTAADGVDYVRMFQP